MSNLDQSYRLFGCRHRRNNHEKVRHRHDRRLSRKVDAIAKPRAGCDAQTQATQTSISDLAVVEIALMPFLMGQLESPDAPIAKPLSKSFTQLEINALMSR